MSWLFYYEISSNLSEDQKIEIARRVAKDQKAVYLFFKILPSESNRQVRKLGLYVAFIFTIGQPLVPCAAAVMLPLPINRGFAIEEQSILRNQNVYPQIVSMPQQEYSGIPKS